MIFTSPSITGFGSTTSADRYFETAVLNYDASADAVEEALSKIPDIGIVEVSKSHDASHTTWDVTFHTCGEDIPDLIMLTTVAGTQSSDFTGDKYGNGDCPTRSTNILSGDQGTLRVP